jgi:hypothetical protein
MAVMLGEAISFVLSNLPGFLFVAALVLAGIFKRPEHFPARLLSWLLLLSVGVENLWFGFFHIAFPSFAASTIGWQTSPFQFEIGAADASLGIVALISFWRSLDFKAAVVFFVTLFYAGVAIGHVHQAISEGNMSPNNFGLLLLLTVVKIFLLPVLYVLARREQPR